MGDDRKSLLLTRFGIVPELDVSRRGSMESLKWRFDYIWRTMALE